LASAFTRYNDKPIFVTGGNDNTIVIWEVQDCAGPTSNGKKNNNGMLSLPLAVSS
jgi:di- and tripeptidase